jgi:hypothetical protein
MTQAELESIDLERKAFEESLPNLVKLRNNLLLELNAIGDYKSHKKLWDAFYAYEEELYK